MDATGRSDGLSASRHSTRPGGTPRASAAATNGSPSVLAVACDCRRSMVAASGSASASAGRTRWRARSAAAASHPPAPARIDRRHAAGRQPARARGHEHEQQRTDQRGQRERQQRRRADARRRPGPRRLPDTTPSGSPISGGQRAAPPAPAAAVLRGALGHQPRHGPAVHQRRAEIEPHGARPPTARELLARRPVQAEAGPLAPRSPAPTRPCPPVRT